MADSKLPTLPSDRPTESPSLFGLGLKYLPLWVAVAAGLWTVWTHVHNEEQARIAAAAQAERDGVARNAQAERDGRTRLLEAQKPFLDRQLKLYFETAEVAGFLATATPSQDSLWTSNYSRFERLYWSELSMVEHLVVEVAMGDYRKKLRLYANAPTPTAEAQSDLQQSAYRLAHAIRAGIQSSWGDPRQNIVASPP